jgi:hypothetical protein
VRALTVRGNLVATNILNNPHAAALSIYVICAFVKTSEDPAAILLDL